MCGIVGSFKDFIVRDDLKSIELSLQNMYDRGPDFQDFIKVNDKIILGHSRLTIIDTSSHANQPFKINDYFIVFNGEIYNFLKLRENLKQKGVVFTSTSDTEVLLQYCIQYGIDKTLEDIDGMFAFCIVDLRKNKSYLARDRFGQKPLYINTTSGISFASTIESLKTISPKGEIDKKVIFDYLITRFVPTEKTIYSNIIKVKPAECLEIDLGTLSISRQFIYWKPEYNLSTNKYNIKNLSNLIEESVQNHMYSDVPMALFLSGGIDSSLVSYYASRKNKNLEAIHAQFVGEQNDELKYAQYVSEKLNIKLHNIKLEKFSNTTYEDIQQLLKKVGQPFADPAILPQYLVAKKAKELGFKVVLTGDGGDEIFGGYPIYRKAKLFKWARYLPTKIYKDLYKIKEKKEGYVYFNTNDYEIKQIAKTIVDGCTASDSLSNLFHLENNDYMQLFSKYDIYTKLPNEFLTKVDTATMYASIESRSPFLNHKIFEYVWSKNYNNLASIKEGKLLLKKISNNIFGSTFTYRKKTGFEAPMENWLLENMKIFKYVFNRNRKIFKEEILDYEQTVHLVSANKKYLWRYYNLIEWYENES